MIIMKEKEKNLDEKISKAINGGKVEFDFDRWKKNNPEAMEALKNPGKSGQREQTNRLQIWNFFRRKLIMKLAAAAVIVIGIFLGVLYFDIFSGSVVWADIVERFKSVNFFEVTLYMKEDAVSEPKQIELWMSRKGKVRIRTGNQVVFGENGKVSKAYDVKSRGQTTADGFAYTALQKLGDYRQFSLDTVVRLMFNSELEETTPLINADAAISQDMVVFDMTSKSGSQWLRIWALCESKLPVRIKVWTPRDGGCDDIFFTYSREQPDEFFDPNALEKVLENFKDLNAANIVYAYLKDPGKKLMTPEEIFKQKGGYHLPEIEQIGITEKGAVWVISRKAMNQMPNGNPFYGFGTLEDDLGREYKRLTRYHITAEDRAIEIFVPLDYPFDNRIPAKLSLVCNVPEDDPRLIGELIGKIDVSQWQQGQFWPSQLYKQDETWLKVGVANWLFSKQDYSRMEKIISSMTGDPQTSSEGFEREKLRLRLLVSQKKFEQAETIADLLFPLELERYKKWDGYPPSPDRFSDYIKAKAATGNFDQAKQIWNTVLNVKLSLPESSNKAALQKINKIYQDEIYNKTAMLALDLVWQVNLTAAEVKNILGIDIRTDERLKGRPLPSDAQILENRKRDKQ